VLVAKRLPPVRPISARTGAMGKIDWAGESTAALSVGDYGKALAWYRDVHGFEVVFELESWGWAQLQSPVTGLLVGIVQAEAVKQGGGATLTFTVTDIDAARAYLEGEGVRFAGETSQVEDMVRLATFYDPDGNALMLAEQLK
jgi:predicted enzyme related to lactoylglutathione lyase